MKCNLSHLSALQKALLLSSFVFGNAGLSQTPHFIGRNGCATATCHGGLIGDGPVWHSSASRWESQDPHRIAGETLTNDLSRRIVIGLEFASTQSSTVFAKVLKERCVSCHAPEAIPSAEQEPVDIAANFKKQLSRGVGCESCHGPASAWEELHTQHDWSKRNRFNAAIGMRETESLLARVDNCCRCHVGSRTADAVVRDMNHEMIAAGHPVLAFDMVRYEKALPSHWVPSKSAFQPSQSGKLVSRAAAARSRVLSAAAHLSTERSAASKHTSSPELSEFGCASCHHQVSLSSFGIDSHSVRSMSSGALSMGSSTSGYPLWNKWFTVGNSIGFQVNELSFDCSDLEKRVAIIGRESAQRSQQLLHVEETDPLAFLKASLSLALNDSRLRSQIVGDASNVRVWFDNIEIAVHAASLQLSESGHERVEASLNAFRREKLGEIPGQSISSRILNRVGCDKSDIEKLCTELMLATKE